jgi:hypothetical protein
MEGVMPDDMKAPFTAEEAAAELVRRYPTAFNGVDPLSQHGGLKLENARDWVLAAALLSERRKMAEALEKASEAMAEAIQWDKARGFRMPYRVRDPLFAAIDRNKVAALTGSREHG